MGLSVSSKKMTWILGVAGFLAIGSLLYMVQSFFRMDRVTYETESFFWQVQSLVCDDGEGEPILVFSEKKDGDAQVLLRFSQPLHNHINQLGSEQVEVSRRVVGRLAEWEGSGIVVAQAVGGKKVIDSWRLSEQELDECEVQPNVTIKPLRSLKKVNVF